MKRKVFKSSILVRYVILVGWVVVCLVPIVMAAAASLNRTTIFVSPIDLLLLRDFSLNNYVSAYKMGNFPFYLRNSLIISLSSVAAVVFVCTPLAYGLTKFKSRTRNALTFSLISMRFIPYVVIAVPLYLFLARINLSGTLLGLLMAHLAMHIPFATWLLYSFFDELPYEVEEAAIVDGCSTFRVFWNIKVPMILQGLNAAAMLVFIMSWNEYLFGLFLAGSNAQPLTVSITRFLGGEGVGAQYGMIAAYGIMILAPVIIFSILVNRYIVSGLTSGAVKG